MKKKLLAVSLATILTLSLGAGAFAQESDYFIQGGILRFQASEGWNLNGSWQDASLSGYGKKKQVWAQCGKDKTTSKWKNEKTLEAYAEDYGPYGADTFKAGYLFK